MPVPLLLSRSAREREREKHAVNSGKSHGCVKYMGERETQGARREEERTKWEETRGEMWRSCGAGYTARCGRCRVNPRKVVEWGETEEHTHTHHEDGGGGHKPTKPIAKTTNTQTHAHRYEGGGRRDERIKGREMSN